MQESVLVQLIAHNHPHQPLHASEICILNMNKSNESNVGRGSKKKPRRNGPGTVVKD